jgi:hypothetical protein
MAGNGQQQKADTGQKKYHQPFRFPPFRLGLEPFGTVINKTNQGCQIAKNSNDGQNNEIVEHNRNNSGPTIKRKQG